MSTDNRNRVLAALIIALVIPVGLLARSHRADANWATLSGFLATYLGDTLWPVMFYFMGRLLLPKASTRTLIAVTLGITLTLEFGQLWKPPTLQWMRQQPLIGFILGNQFIWTDVLCCTAGTAFAFFVDVFAIARCKTMANAG